MSAQIGVSERFGYLFEFREGKISRFFPYAYKVLVKEICLCYSYGMVAVVVYKEYFYRQFIGDDRLNS